MRCAKCIHHNICYYEEEVIDPDKNNDCENFEEVRPHGKWIGVVYSKNRIGVGMCNQCGSNRIVDNFCPNCGADMRGEE